MKTNQIVGTLEEAAAIARQPKTHEQVVSSLQYQLNEYGDFTVTKDGAADELEPAIPALAHVIKQMPEEAGAACYMAARMIRECVCLIKEQAMRSGGVQ